MRDYFVTLVVFASLPLILRKPFFGVLVWTWLGLMNPHKLCWGFATSMPFAQLVAIAILLGWLISKESKRISWTPISGLLAVWWAWMLVTSFFALADPWEQWDKVWKIMLLTFITLSLLTTRERMQALVWVCVVSLGLYGVKGGIFTVATGGVHAVWGPAGTFIGGNNEVALALIMTIPLMRYLQLSSESKLIRNAMLGSMVTTLFAIVGTQSRGAFVGLAAMATYLVIKSRNKAGLLLLLLLALPAVFLLMPESWYERMGTIETYDMDASALGRINAWWTAFYLALDHPLTGGGFEVFNARTFLQYAPNPHDVHDAHSIYFEVLGEQGFVGLILFLSIGLGSLLTLNRVRRFAAKHEQLTWMRDLASMLFVSLVGYATSGAFLGLAYFDFYYLLVALTSSLAVLAARYRTEGLPEPVAQMPAPAGWGPRPRSGPPGRKVNIVQRASDWYQKL